jgi:hypothetical protein
MLIIVLKSMTDEQRRTHIDDGLVADLDEFLVLDEHEEAREMYGPVGRFSTTDEESDETED